MISNYVRDNFCPFSLIMLQYPTTPMKLDIWQDYDPARYPASLPEEEEYNPALNPRPPAT